MVHYRTKVAALLILGASSSSAVVRPADHERSAAFVVASSGVLGRAHSPCHAAFCDMRQAGSMRRAQPLPSRVRPGCLPLQVKASSVVLENDPYEQTTTGKYLYELDVVAAAAATAPPSSKDVDDAIPTSVVVAIGRAALAEKEVESPRGVPDLYTAPQDHQAAVAGVRRRRGVCEKMVPTEDLAKWFKNKLEEVDFLKYRSPLLHAGMLVYGKREDGSLVRGKLLSLGRRRSSQLVTGKILLDQPPAGARTTRGKKMHTERFRLPCIFPVGGCNGGLETHLEEMVRGRQGKGAAGDSMLQREVEQVLRTGRTEVGSVLRLYCGGDEAIERVLLSLERHKTRMMQGPFDAHQVDLSAEDVQAARVGFRSAMARGEEALARFGQVLADRLFRSAEAEESRFTAHLQVTGEYECAEGQRESFTFVETLKGDQEGPWQLAAPGQGLGAEMLSHMRVLPVHLYYARLHAADAAGRATGVAPFDARRELLEEGLHSCEDEGARAAADPAGAEAFGGAGEGGYRRSKRSGWVEPREVSHDIVYEARDSAGAGAGVVRIYAHKKNDDEIFDLMADKLTGVDALTLSSSERGHSVLDAIHNVLVVKVVVESAARARSLLAELRALEFSEAQLAAYGVPYQARGEAESTAGIEILEVQDHLDEQHYLEHLLKYGEWKALAVTVRWWGVPIMLVLKPVDTQYVEQERCRAESYAGHKEQQRRLRAALAHKWPIYRFLRSLSQWVLAGDQPASDGADAVRPPAGARAQRVTREEPPGRTGAPFRVPASLPRVRVRVHSSPDWADQAGGSSWSEAVAPLPARFLPDRS